MRGRGAKRKTGLNCTGEQLPDTLKIQSVENPQCFDVFCTTIDPGESILLYEKPLDSPNYYWVILGADNSTLGACNLERYADWLEKQGQWSGRRADYLVVGSTNGDCYLLVIELRRTLVKKEQGDDKFEQLKETLTTLIRDRLPAIHDSSLQDRVYECPPSYKIIGVVIAPGNTRQFSRGELNESLTIESHRVLIRTLPRDALQECSIMWSDLLKRLGAVEVAFR